MLTLFRIQTEMTAVYLSDDIRGETFLENYNNG